MLDGLLKTDLEAEAVTALDEMFPDAKSGDVRFVIGEAGNVRLFGKTEDSWIALDPFSL